MTPLVTFPLSAQYWNNATNSHIWIWPNISAQNSLMILFGAKISNTDQFSADFTLNGTPCSISCKINDDTPSCSFNNAHNVSANISGGYLTVNSTLSIDWTQFATNLDGITGSLNGGNAIEWELLLVGSPPSPNEYTNWLAQLYAPNAAFSGWHTLVFGLPYYGPSMNLTSFVTKRTSTFTINNSTLSGSIENFNFSNVAAVVADNQVTTNPSGTIDKDIELASYIDILTLTCGPGYRAINNFCYSSTISCGTNYCIHGDTCCTATGKCCSAGTTCCGNGCCSSSEVCLNDTCYPKGTTLCGTNYCNPQETCCTNTNTCCPKGTTCCGTNCCDANHPVCTNGICCISGYTNIAGRCHPPLKDF